MECRVAILGKAAGALLLQVKKATRLMEDDGKDTHCPELQKVSQVDVMFLHFLHQQLTHIYEEPS